MRVTILTGGGDAARYVLDAQAALDIDAARPGAGPGDDHLTVIVSTAGDLRLHDLHLSPDLDACLYASAGIADTSTGAVAAELAAFGAEGEWFPLTDRDVAISLVRTRMLNAGYSLSAVTAALATRWRPGIELLPMTDDRVETRMVISDPDGGAGGADDAEPRDIAVHVREWLLRFGAAPSVHTVVHVGAESARPAPGVVDAIVGADLVLIAPTDPGRAVDALLTVPGIREALESTSARVVNLSAIRPDAVMGAVSGPASGDGLADAIRSIKGPGDD